MNQVLIRKLLGISTEILIHVQILSSIYLAIVKKNFHPGKLISRCVMADTVCIATNMVCIAVNMVCFATYMVSIAANTMCILANTVYIAMK